jgi:hypothetical protein
MDAIESGRLVRPGLVLKVEFQQATPSEQQSVW